MNGATLQDVTRATDTIMHTGCYIATLLYLYCSRKSLIQLLLAVCNLCISHVNKLIVSLPAWPLLLDFSSWLSVEEVWEGELRLAECYLGELVLLLKGLPGS